MSVREGQPDLIDLPWHLPLDEWPGATPRVVEIDRGLSRHTVVFIEYDSALYALKELPPERAEREYALLRGMEDRRLPAVRAVGHARAMVTSEGAPLEIGVLITAFLEGSLPYRRLFMNQGMEVLEHKWYLSERHKRDVGMQAAIDDYLRLRESGEIGSAVDD